MKEDSIVRPYRQGDEEEIIQLLDTVFKGWPHFDLNCSSLDHWKWKFEDNPLKMISIAIGEGNNRIIGCLHLTPRIIKIGSKCLLCFLSVDTAVHPDFRRMGAWNRMNELRQKILTEANANLVFAVSGNPILIRMAIKLGWIRFPRPIIELVRIRDFDLHLKMMPTKYAWMKKYGYHLLKVMNTIRITLPRTPGLKHGFHIEEIKCFDDRIETFWNNIKDHYSFIHERSRKHLNWRYCDPRGGDYIVKLIEENGFIVGYIVLRTNTYRENYPIGYIIDLLALPDRLDVADALIDNSIHYFDDLKVNVIRCWVVKNHPYEKLLNRHGLLNKKTKLFVSYLPIQVGSEIDEFKTAQANRIHFQLGDTDHI